MNSRWRLSDESAVLVVLVITWLLSLSLLALIFSACASATDLDSTVQKKPSAAATMFESGIDSPSPAAGEVYAGFRVLRSSCRSKNPGQGAPIVICRQRPIVGEPFRIGWTVNPTGPFEENRSTWLLVWFDSATPTDVSSFGYTGCTLWAPLDTRRLFTLIPRPGSMLTQTGGEVQFHGTWPQSWVGRRVFCQLAVASPGANPRDWLLSPALGLRIGTK